MAWAELDASTYASFAACLTAADAIKDTTGSVVLLPGGEGQAAGGTYDGDGLTLPRNTQLIGHGNPSHIICPTTRFKAGSVTGQMLISRIVFDDGFNLLNARNSKIELCEFQDEVLVDGACFYNVFDTCQWQDLGTSNALVTDIDGNQNANTLLNPRINSINGVTITANGWNVIGGAFEGDGATDEVLGVFLTFAGNNNSCVGTWFERGGNRTFGTNAIHLTSVSDGCMFLGGSPGFLVDVKDDGGATVANKVYPPFQRAA